MPNTIKDKPVTRRVRKNLDPRKIKKRSGCQGRKRTTPTTNQVIANSIFALTLNSKPSIEIVNKNGGRSFRYDQDDYTKMYHDLLACYQNALKIVCNTESPFDPLASGLGIGISIEYILGAFRNNILPFECDFNIDHDHNNGYYFTIYKECDVPFLWQAFEIKPIVDHLKYKPDLLNIFLDVITLLAHKTAINVWFADDGIDGYVEEILSERIANWEFDGENDKEYFESLNALATYKYGHAKELADKISEIKPRKPGAILKKLNSFDKRNSVVHWLKEACKFLQMPGCMYDFKYFEFMDEGNEGLLYDRQVSIIYDWKDPYTSIMEEFIDAEANGCGILPPMLNIGITKELKEFNKQKFIEQADWPIHLYNLWESYHRGLINKLFPKRY